MNITLTKKIIQDRCGTVSFKRGEAFYLADKVSIEYYSADRCEATVSGVEDFHVAIEGKGDGAFVATCSCPTLASVKKDCQHVAAVLLALSDQGQEAPFGNALTEGVYTLFQDRPKLRSGHQRHFEKREVLEVTFVCKLVEQRLFAMELILGDSPVKNIHAFLQSVEKGLPFSAVNYDPSKQCFDKETDAVLQCLIQLAADDNWQGGDRLTISSSAWETIEPHLQKAPYVKLDQDGQIYDELYLSDEALSLQFIFAEKNGGGYRLSVTGLKRMVVLPAYDMILSFYGKLIKVKTDDCRRLFELKQLLEASGTNHIPIHEDQLKMFLEKVVPGLRKLGTVKFSDGILQKMTKTKLVAKLYLDRVKNRLLAGLEFHYDNIIVNPLENRDPIGAAKIVRDKEKEERILQFFEDGEFAKTEEGFFLHNEELEYEFLYHQLHKVQKLVQIYATTAVRNRIAREPAKPKISVRVKKERTNWLEFKFDIDGIPQSQIKELLHAIEEKRKYYRMKNGSLMSLETREIEEIQRFLHAAPVQEEDLESGLNVPVVQGLKLLETVDDQSIIKAESSFRQFLGEIRNPGSMDFEVPEQLVPILRDYQVQGFKWLKTLAHYGFGGILADDMGLGKTVQSITYIQSELANIRKSKQPVLIVCPSSLTYNWLSELMKFAPQIRAIVIDGVKNERDELLKKVEVMDVIIISYPLLRRETKWFENMSFHTIFFDEAQAFKNPITQTARVVKRLQADHRFALTGTPVENSIEELWSIFHVVFPELFMGLREYSNLTRKQIARRIRPFLLRRLKEDVLTELPEKQEIIESVELLPEQKKLYAAYLAKLREDTLKHLNKDTLRKNKIRILAGLTRLRQICCHPGLFVDGYNGGAAKFDMLLRIIEESKLSGRRVLIFSQFTKMLELIGRELTYQGVPYFYLDGQTPSEERVETCRKFNKGERDYFLISLKAGGTGLNLTGADTVILYDLWWNPAVEEQAADRAHRIGQTNVVQVIKLVSHGTIEEKINELQDKKRHLVEEIIDPGEKVSSTLTEEDIREILKI
ncbi:DEAD/DEAH box helicase [Bacillus tianshenii]|uniref:DEAD/DEAH box helicase n=1 Tax=Sutcliffiella tianshenii TaxID=1463404 RepID=UPI001CD6F30E|nr:DEAD/DEAH box helicase [Bacillus tianshenii]MCA1321018.1 DEAD/DEAH box helicase [Bacillus tianshenii]